MLLMVDLMDYVRMARLSPTSPFVNLRSHWTKFDEEDHTH
jgi:hypothetical protein